MSEPVSTDAALRADHLAGAPNRAARLARWMGRGHRYSPLLRLIIICGIVIAWLAFSVWGEASRGGSRSIAMLVADATYRPFTFLSPDGDYGEGSAIPLQWVAARFLGALLPVIGLFWVIRRWLMLSLARGLVQYAASGHVIIVSDEGAANALAAASSRAGDCVVLIDPSLEDDSSDRDRLAEEGVVILSSQPLLRMLRRARVTSAHQTACWSRCDSQNLEHALLLHSLPLHNDIEIVLKVNSRDAQPMLHSMSDLVQANNRRFRPIAPEVAALRAALDDQGLVADAVAGGQAQVCVALHGCGPTLLEIGELVLQHNWSIHLGPPQLLVIAPLDRDTSGCKEMAALLARQAQVFEPGMAPSVRHLSVGDLAHVAVTRHLVECDSDESTLAHAFALAAALRQQSQRDFTLQPILRGNERLGGYLSKHAREFASPVYLGQHQPLGKLLERSEDEAAARLHIAYQAANGEEPIAQADWRTLPETFIHANRAAADHAAIKQWDVAQAATSGADGDTMLQSLAAVEHRRWCTERLLEGWLPGPRDNRRRLHDKLIPWDELSADDQKKDIDQVLLALALGPLENRQP